MALTKATYAMIDGAPVNVLDFGAVGNGTNDDTVAIQAALTHAGTIKCGVYVPGTASYYKITDELTVPDGVAVCGDGWGSFIQQVTQNKDVFIAGDCNTFQNLRLKIADGDNSDFTNCIYAVNVNNLTVDSCFLESADLGGCGVHIRGAQNSQIINNRIYGGKWTSGAGAAASAADILLYSAVTSERHIIQGNHCLSNNSQGMFVSALGYDGDLIISNNICVTLDPATCTETGTWSLATSGGVRRHGIVVSYSNAQPGRPRTIVDSNICRNTLWAGIYKQGLSDGEILISNNLCDLNGYVITSLAAGIYVESPGAVSVVGNTISNFQCASTANGGITLNQASNENALSLVANNKIINSNGAGIALGTFSRLVNISNNTIIGSAFSDIYIVNGSGNADVGGNTIVENRIYRTSGNTLTGIYVDQGNSTRPFIVKNNYIQGFDNANNSLTNVGILVRDSSNRPQIENNTVQNFYYGFRCTAGYNDGRMNDRIIQNNVIRDCAVGFLAFSTVNNFNTLPLVGNVFINTSTQVDGGGNPIAGRIVTRQGDNFIWQTTASPTVGSWAVGDRSVNSSPAIGSPKAWVCTVAGAPGTWTSEGNL